MIRIEESERFPVSVEEGFAYVTDPERWPEFWPGLVSVAPGARWREPGDVSRLAMRLLGRRTELVMTLQRFEPGRLVEYTTTQRGLPDARHTRGFAADGDGFRYTLGVELEPRPGLRGVLDRTLVARAVRRALRQTLRNLAARLGPSNA
ncbi:MAG TPA: SRPBCC family protein [Gaiellaceae bacterium]|nr:SRPBCC family protein [Gaiellaceae bacterium]